jgi:uncharacterized SAM-binding protein YcdF (DUF218 family)
VHRAAKVSILAFGVAAFAVGAGFAAFSARILSYDPMAPASGDAIVVLTGGEQRVREGLRLYEMGAGRRVLVSGVNASTTKDDLLRHSGAMSQLLQCCVDIGHIAHNTIGNAIETRAWQRTWGFRKLVVVTSNYHMPRSLVELSWALPDVELVPHAVVSRNYQARQLWRHPAAIKLTAVEYLKYLRASARAMVMRAVAIPDAAEPSDPPGTALSLQPRLSGF